MGLAAALMSGCSSDVSRFTDPFSNPFGSTNNVSQNGGNGAGYARAPVSRVSSRPLGPTSRSSVAYNDPGPARVSRPIAVGGSSAGWSAAGGTPIVLAQGENVGQVAQRYGVPATAILKVNGYETVSEVRPGTRLIIPVYNGRGRSDVASAETSRHVDVADRVRARDRRRIAERSDDESERRATHKSRRVADRDEDRDDRQSRRHAARDEDREEGRSRRHASRDEDREESRSHRRAGRDEDREHVKSKRTAERDEDREHVKSKRTAERDEDREHVKSKRTAERDEGDKDGHERAKSRRTAERDRDSAHDNRGKRHEEAEKTQSSKTAKTRVADEDSRKVASREVEPAPKKAPQQLASRTQSSTDATPTGSLPPGGKAEFRWPARGRITQGFKPGSNDGINIAVPEGTSVKAVEGGVVAYAGSELKGYGNMVLIRHPNGFVSAYANNGQLDVKRGDSVKRGQTIAKSGQSGNVSAPQLHFELRKGSTPVDPTGYLAGL